MPNSNNTIEVTFKPKYPKAKKIVPLLFMLAIILADQITKYLVVKNIPLTYPPSCAASFFDDFIRIIHVSNPAIAFSIGHGWAYSIRVILFRVVPLIVLILVLGVYFRNDDFSQLQRWSIAGIAGGGFGNLIDRFFRAEGVVDFVDVWFPQSLIKSGRWPTFNVADMAVVVCGILLIISFIFFVKSEKAGADE